MLVAMPSNQSGWASRPAVRHHPTPAFYENLFFNFIHCAAAPRLCAGDAFPSALDGFDPNVRL